MKGENILKKGDRLFVRIDYKNDTDMEIEPNVFKEHIEYLEGIAEDRLFIGGGFEHEKGGMIIYKARDLEEAKYIADHDPIIKSQLYSYKINEWNLAIVSKKI